MPFALRHGARLVVAAALVFSLGNPGPACASGLLGRLFDEGDPPITAVAFSPDSGSVVMASQAEIIEVSWPQLTPVRRLQADIVQPTVLTFSPEGRWLAVAGGTPGEEGVVQLLSWPAGEAERRLAVHDDVVYGAAFSPDGRRMVIASLDRSTRVIELESSRTQFSLRGHSRGPLAAEWSADGRWLFTGGIDRVTRVWNAETGAEVRTLMGHTETINGLANRPLQSADDPAQLASIAADRTVRFWQPGNGRLLRFARLDAEPLALAWTDCGKCLLVCGTDGWLRAVDAETLVVTPLARAIDGWAHCLAVSGQQVVVGGAAGQLTAWTLDLAPDKPPAAVRAGNSSD